MTPTTVERRSPVHLPGKLETTESRDGWPVVLAYADEGPGPWVVDLSHLRRWDIQGAALAAAAPKGLALPAAPGRGRARGRAPRRPHRDAAGLSVGFGGKPPAMGPACTETTEGSACIALLGRDVLRITEKLTSLDFGNPAFRAPFLLWVRSPTSPARSWSCRTTLRPPPPWSPAAAGSATIWCMPCCRPARSSGCDPRAKAASRLSGPAGTKHANPKLRPASRRSRAAPGREPNHSLHQTPNTNTKHHKPKILGVER